MAPKQEGVPQKEIESEPFIEVNEEVRNKVLEIVGDIKEKKEQAKLLFIWVRDNIKYKHPPKVWAIFLHFNQRAEIAAHQVFFLFLFVEH